jgi:L-2-amino-thiazoline-4-carboxylic acid hydrolase-like protein
MALDDLNPPPARGAKASAQLDLRKITTPILLHLLRGRLRFPFLFLLKCKLTANRFRKTIDPRFPAELVDMCALPLWVYIKLKEKLGQKPAFEIMRIAILTGGIARWNFAYRAVEEERTFKNLCDEELIVNQSGPTRWNTLEVVERTERRFEIKITRCLYHELTTAMGVPELTPVICQIDNAAFNSYLPDQVSFTRGGPGHRISDGARECNFKWDFIG